MSTIKRLVSSCSAIPNSSLGKNGTAFQLVIGHMSTDLLCQDHLMLKFRFLTYVSGRYVVLITVGLQPRSLVVVGTVSVAADVQTLWSLINSLESESRDWKLFKFTHRFTNIADSRKLPIVSKMPLYVCNYLMVVHGWHAPEQVFFYFLYLFIILQPSTNADFLDK